MSATVANEQTDLDSVSGLIGTLSKVRDKVLGKYPGLILFAIVRPENRNTWDVIVSGSDISGDRDGSRIIDWIKNDLRHHEVAEISRVVVLGYKNDFVRNLTRLFNMSQGTLSLKNVRLNELEIYEAHLLYSKRA